MMVVVTFVSLMVHVYTVGYMADDRATSDSSPTSRSHVLDVMLVMANNFLQLFFRLGSGGLVSYLLIGFWYTRPSRSTEPEGVPRQPGRRFRLPARRGARARVLRHARLRGGSPGPPWREPRSRSTGAPWLVVSAICIGLFIGAMGKSGGIFPCTCGCPDSMEGPTPISALIHAATMVTAGIFMVARMSPLFELSETALSLCS